MGNLRSMLSAIKGRVGRVERWLRGSSAPLPETDPLMPGYEKWLDNYGYLSSQEIEKCRSSIEEIDYKPLISIVIPVYNTDRRLLDATLKSIRNQVYSSWELCVADDCSSASHVRELLEAHKDEDARIRVVYRQKNGHISAATNSALALARGEFVGFVDHDDVLSTDALYQIVRALNRRPDADMLFTDQDFMDLNGQRSGGFFKLGFSAEMILCWNYMAHFLVVRRTCVEAIGGLRVGLEGSQDHDLILRLLDHTEKVVHVPKMVYHWRRHDESTAANPQSKLYAHDNGLKAVRDCLLRRGVDAVAEKGSDLFTIKVAYRTPPDQSVSILIPFKNKYKLLNNCISSITRNTTGLDYEIILLDNETDEFDPAELVRIYADRCRIRCVACPGPFNFAAVNNRGASLAKGSHLLLLNNDTEVENENWLSEMLQHSCRDEVGAVGAMLLYPDGRIQHAGVVLAMTGLAGHIYQGMYENRVPHGVTRFARDVTAVTGACLLTRKDVYQQLKGLDERFSLCGNDVDYCLRVQRSGLRVLFTPHARLVHHESQSRDPAGIPASDFKHSIEAYTQYLHSGDPYYNANLSLLSQEGRPRTFDETERWLEIIRSLPGGDQFSVQQGDYHHAGS